MYKILATDALKDLVAAHKAIKRWLAWCDGLSAAKKAAGLYEADLHDNNYSAWLALSIEVEKTYVAVNKRPPMPSKNRKHQMYSNAYRAAQLADVEIAPGSIRDMDDIARVIADVTAALAVS